MLLVIDDDQISGNLTSAVLINAGFETIIYTDPVKALAYLKDEGGKEVINLVVSDQNMPEISGSQLCATLRDSGIKTPFILLSGDNNPKLILDCMHKGVTRVLCKNDKINSLLPVFVKTILN